MSTLIAARLARRELRGGLRGFRIFLACLALGVAAIAAVGTVRQSIEEGLAQDGAALLGGDAEMEFTYRFASDAERLWMNEIALSVSEVTDFRSLAVVERGATPERALTQVKSVDDLYPLIGEVDIEPDLKVSTALSSKEGVPGALMERVLADHLALKTGDIFRLGTQEFRLNGVITGEPDSAGAGFGLGPRTIVYTDDLKNSSLLGAGTLFTTKYRLKLPAGTDLAALEADALRLFRDSGMRWTDARNGAPGVAAFVNRIGAFLILVGLSGLAVGGVGVSAAVRAYLAEKTGVIATLKTLGADRQTIFLTYFFQIGVLTIAGIFLGLVLGTALPLILAPVISASLPIPAVFGLHPEPLFEAAVYGVLAALVFTLWPLARTNDVKAATLFRDAMQGGRLFPHIGYLVVIGLLVAVLLGAAIVFSGTVTLTLWTAGGILISLGFLAFAALALASIARRATRLKLARGRPSLRLALGAIGGPRQETTSVVLSLGLGLTVLASVGQIDGNLRNAISQNLPEIAPSYFFVDIQNDQLPGFMERLNGDDDVSRVETAPMLRGIITQINGQPAREVAGEHWVLAGDRGVTYSAAKPESTTLTAGEWWPTDYSGPPLISFAAEEAEEMGLKIGDNLSVNILGRDITGTIASFREVDFSNAGIGFILTMNPGALAGAPHTHIATVYASERSEAAILRDLASAFPNITAIRVRDAIDRIADLLAGIAAATSYGAAATLLTGFLVLIGAAAAGQSARVYEAAILKTLGATRGRILASFALRSALLGAAAGVVALGAGIGGGWAVSRFVMETEFSVIWPSALAIVAGGAGATLLAGLVFAWRPLAASPAQVLRARE